MPDRSSDPRFSLEEERLFAFLSYCFVLCLVPLFRKRDNDFVLFHGRQGLALFLCEMAAFLVTIVFPALLKLFLFVFILVSLWGMVNALRGLRVRLPLIHDLSERLIL